MRLCVTNFAAVALSMSICALPAANKFSVAQASEVAPQADTPTVPVSPPPAVFKSSAELVLIDVLVSKGGKPIHGIPRKQFQLFEDGREQNLTAVDEHRAIDPVSVQRPPKLPPNIYSDAPELPVPEAVNVLLLDALNTPMANQAYVRQQMIAYLKNIQPGTRVGIFTLASRLRMVQGITSNSRPLLAALNGKTAIGKSNLPTQSALLTDASDTSMSDIEVALSDASGSQLMAGMQQFEADQVAFQMDLRVRYTLDALQELASYLRAVPGRKNLIWLSGSFPINLDPDATQLSPFEAMRSYAPDVRATSSMLAASRVAVYPVDARGLFGDSQFNAETSGSGMSGGGGSTSAGGSRRGSRGIGGLTASQPKFAQNSMKFMQQTAAEHATMQEIAEETGGHAYFNNDAIEDAVAQAIQNGADYYTLAYVRQTKDDGRFHRIQVALPEATAEKLTYRRGYVAELEKKQSANPPSIAAAILRGAPPLSEVIFVVRVLPADDPALKSSTLQPGPAGEVSPKVKSPLKRYQIDYAADLHTASLTESADGIHQVSLEFVTVAYDRDGTRLSYVDKAFTIKIPSAQFGQVMQKGLKIQQEIDVPAGEVYLRAAVRDLKSDHVGSVEIPLMVKPTASN